MTEPWIEDAKQTVEPTEQIRNALQRRTIALDDIERLDTELKLAKKTLRQIEEEELPQLFDAMNVTEVRDALTGKRLRLEQTVTASLTNPEVRQRAIDWLRQHGMDDLIERTVAASFRRGEDEAADRALTALTQLGYRVSSEELVNTASFKAAVRELMEQGEMIPTDDIGVFVVRKVVIKN